MEEGWDEVSRGGAEQVGALGKGVVQGEGEAGHSSGTTAPPTTHTLFWSFRRTPLGAELESSRDWLFTAAEHPPLRCREWALRVLRTA